MSQGWTEPKSPITNKSPRHVEVSTKSKYSDTLRLPLKYQIVYSAVILPQGTTRIFGILYNDKVYTKVSAFAPTGVMSSKGFTLLSDRDYKVYKQWLQTPSKSKSRFDAERMQWTEDNAELLIQQGNEKESKRLGGQNEYERAQKLNQEYIITSVKVGDKLEFQFDKTIWTVLYIKNDTVYAMQNNRTDRAPISIGTTKSIRGYKLI